MTSTKVQLYCPSKHATVDNFVVAPYATNEQILQGVRLALNIKHAALYTIGAKPVTDAHSLQEDQRVLVAAAPAEQMLPDAPPGFVLYNGEEGDEVDPDVEGAGQGWENLTDRERCEHIMSLNTVKPSSRNKLRVTRPWQSVQADLATFETILPETIDTSAAETNIEQCWQLTYDHFLPSSMAPPKFKIAGKIWDEQVVGALGVLSSFTHGQATLAQGFLEEAVKMRIEEEGKHASATVQVQDVNTAIGIIYERAGFAPTKLTKAKTKAGGRERRKAMKEKKRKDMSS